MKPFLLALGIAMTVGSGVQAAPAEFERVFADSTLRLDYVMAGDLFTPSISLHRQSMSPGWAGRRSRLDRLPLGGNGAVTVRDKATGDTIYCQSFSALSLEWLSLPEASESPRAFENTFLTPLPRAEAIIDIAVWDGRRDTIASMSHIYRPDDVLIERRGFTSKTPHRVLRQSTHPDDAIDVAILAEGYTAGETEKFYADADSIMSALLAHEPFTSRADDFNFVAVAAPSAESGVSIPKEDIWRDTALGSHFSTFHSDRYLTTDRIFTMHDLLSGIPYEHIIAIANTEQYGGSGFYNNYLLTSAHNPLWRPVTVHEFGHSFGGLGDEYFYEGDVMDESYPKDVEGWEPNLTTLTDFSSKWEDLLAPGTPVPTPPELADQYPVGVYEGGGYSFHGIYRPAFSCRMRDNKNPDFCPACLRALHRLIDFYVK